MSSPSRQPQDRPESSGNCNSLRQVDRDCNDELVDDSEIQIKRPRLMPNFILHPESTNNSTPMTELSSDEEIMSSSSLKSTAETIGNAYASCEDICDSNYEGDCSFSSSYFGNKKRKSSSTFHHMDSNLADSSKSSDFMVEKTNTMHVKVLDDNGYSHNNSDVQLSKATVSNKNLPLPARFKTCVQCRKQNDNPYFQYCYKCFKLKKEYIENESHSKRKRIRYTREKSVLKCSQKSSGGLSYELSEKESLNSKNIETGEAEEDENLCNICFMKPKNGIFNHGNIGHIYCCYPCAKLSWKKSSKCPLCNAKIKFVTKLITE